MYVQYLANQHGYIKSLDFLGYLIKVFSYLLSISNLMLFNIPGSHHLKSIEFCQCEHPSITLLKLNLWPGSPERPKVAFHIKLMELVEMLFLQCHVPLYNICKLLDNRRNALLPKLVCAFVSIFHTYPLYHEFFIRDLIKTVLYTCTT